MKLVPTALFAYLLLGQVLSPMQWSSLPVLVVGVVLVTLDANSGGGGGSTVNSTTSTTNSTTSSSSMPINDETTQWQQGFGLLACAISGLSSAYAGLSCVCFPSNCLAYSPYISP